MVGFTLVGSTSTTTASSFDTTCASIQLLELHLSLSSRVSAKAHAPVGPCDGRTRLGRQSDRRYDRVPAGSWLRCGLFTAPPPAPHHGTRPF